MLLKPWPLAYARTRRSEKDRATYTTCMASSEPSSRRPEHNGGPNGECLLCGRHAELQQSHLVPKFVFRWLSSTTPLAIRATDRIDLRVQDIDKARLLCGECEQLLSGWEKSFAERVFYPLHDEAKRVLYYPYEDWALKFCVSVSWRLLARRLREGGLSRMSDQNRERAQAAAAKWRDFLLDKAPNPAPFAQHLLPLSMLTSVENVEVSPFWNRYVLRSIDKDIFELDHLELGDPAFTYTKMGRLILIGIIHFPSSKKWRGTKVHVRSGSVGSEVYEIDQIIMDIVDHRATKAGKTLAQMSPRQKRVVKQAMELNAEAYANSEHALAAANDFRLRGDAARTITRPDSQEPDDET